MLRGSPRAALVGLAGLALVACQGPAAAPSGPAQPTVATTASPAAQPSAPPARAHVEYITVVPIVNYWHEYVAQQEGFFERQNLEVEFSSAGDAARAIQALVSGSVNIGGPSGDSVINAVERGGSGADLAMIAGEINKMAYQLVAGKDVQGYDDLRGKTLAVIGPQDGSTVILKRMLAAHGLQPDDYSFITVGGTANRAAAVQNGTAAAALIGQPQDFRLVADGYKSLGLSSDVVPEYPLDVMTVRRDWAQQNSDVVVRYLRAIIEADRWLYDPANRDAAAQITVDVLKMTPEEGRRTYDLLVTQTQAIPKDGDLSTSGVQAVIDSMAEVGLLSPPLPPPTKYMDLSYLERARQAER
ncbi:MAG TPA: ABC transporter substrate-binding protein [Chloroflexota bacterium]|nr:ABC transporter substrate-binding protein [Chloroflexota bacterium]